MKSRIKVIVTSALLLVASSAFAGIVFLPTSGMVFENVETAAVDISAGPGSTTRIRTTVLSGRLTEAPGGTGPAGSFIGLTQQQELLFDGQGGTLQGRARGTLTLSVTGEQLRYQGDITGDAQCVARSDGACSQLVVTLKLDAVVSAPNDASLVGLIRMEQLGSLVSNAQGARWVALDANVTLGGSEIFINQLLTSMSESDVGV